MGSKSTKNRIKKLKINLTKRKSEYQNAYFCGKQKTSNHNPKNLKINERLYKEEKKNLNIVTVK